MDDIRIENEYKRLYALLDEAQVPKQKQNVLSPVIDNLAWMRAKLDDTRQLIMNSDIVIPYNNGGGQEGLREHPAFKGYVSLWKAYMNGLRTYAEYFPKEMQEEIVNKGKTALDIVKQMKGEK